MIMMSDIPKIQIERQTARIGINTTYAKVEVNDTKSSKKRLAKEAPRMEIERKSPAFKVEPQQRRTYRPALDKMSLSSPRVEIRRPTPNVMLESPENLSNGASLDTNPLELNKAREVYSASANTETMPQNMPTIEWEAGYINISWTNAQMQIEWAEGDYMPSFSVEPHSVEIYMREKPYIKITISDEVIDAMYSPQMDEKA